MFGVWRGGGRWEKNRQGESLKRGKITTAAIVNIERSSIARCKKRGAKGFKSKEKGGKEGKIIILTSGGKPGFLSAK